MEATESALSCPIVVKAAIGVVDPKSASFTEKPPMHAVVKHAPLQPARGDVAHGSSIPSARFGTNIPKLGIIKPNLGIRDFAMASYSGLADALFSGTKRQVLGLLFGQASRSFYTTEIISLVGSGTGSVQRELANLVQSGLVTVKSIGNQKHYQANPNTPIFEELRSIVQKTIGLAEPLRNALGPLHAHLIAAFVYGSIAKASDTASSDIDLMLISDHVTYADVFGALEDTAVRLGRPINPTILTREAFTKRLLAQESFLTRVLDQPKIWVWGGAGDLPA